MVIQVRLDGPTEEAVRKAAAEMGVQVKEMEVQLYGHRPKPVSEGFSCTASSVRST